MRKTAELMRRSNPPLMEWLDSPIIDRASAQVLARLRSFRSTYFDAKKAAHHDLSMAKAFWTAHLESQPQPVREKYLHALRSLACIRFNVIHKQQPPSRFEAVLDGIDWSDRVMGQVRMLVALTESAMELGTADADPILNQHMVETLRTSDRAAAELATHDQANQGLDEFVRDIVLGRAAEVILK
jgi:predicted nucleotidyltransferase